MKERPIIMQAESVRAILDGRKTQTRRVVKPQQKRMWGSLLAKKWWYDVGCTKEAKCPHGKPGDRLWVRETFEEVKIDIPFGDVVLIPKGIYYKADPPYMECPKWKPSIHMPRKFSRILLEITDIRVERVQDISRDDAKAEGTPLPPDTLYPCINTVDKQLASFPRLWDSINKKRGYGWSVNPWCWCLSFKVIKP